MQELLNQARVYLRSVWRNRWFMQAIIWPVCIGGWVFVHFIPNQYESTARVYVKNESIMQPLLQGLAVQTNMQQQVDPVKQAILSRPNLEQVVHTTGLDRKVKTPEDREELFAILKKKILFVGRGSDNLYTITYTDRDPRMCQRVVQALLTTFVQGSLGGAHSDTDRVQQFLDEQIAEYDKRLKDAEDNLAAFKRKYAGVMPSEGHGYYDRLQEANTTLQSAQLQLNEEEKRRDELVKQQQGEEPTFGIVDAPATATVSDATSLDQRIQSLRSKLDDMLLKYTDEHPDVISLRHIIEQLEAQRVQERKRLAANATPVSGMADLRANPVYQQLKISLDQSEANIAALRVRVDEYGQRVRDLQNKVNTVPMVEAQLSQLNRDYDLNKRNYDALVARRESARLSEDASKSSEDTKFKIIDPPRVPVTPISPDRPLLITIVLLGSLILGAGFAIFISQVKPTYIDRRTVASKIKRPILGTVSKVLTPQGLARARRNMVSFVSLTVMLFCMYGGYMAYQVVYL